MFARSSAETISWEYQQFKESFVISWAVYKRWAAWMLTHKLKAKKKQKKKNDHVEHRPRDQHSDSESCFRAANVSHRTASTSPQLRLPYMYRCHPGY